MSIRAPLAPIIEIEYPESDGKPMAETEVHRQEMTDLIESLAEFFRDQPDVYVGGNMLLYYVEGNPRASVAPDVFVVKGVPKHQRRTYQLWREQQPPTVIWEITSRSTRSEDLGHKRLLYATIGVQEYYLFDPLEEYLTPPLQGLALINGEYEQIEPAADGSLFSKALGLYLRREGNRLRLVNSATGGHLLRPAELAAAHRAAEAHAATEAEARRAAEARTATEAEARRAAEARAATEAEARRAAEKELARLRAQLAALRGEDSAS
ncbi:MAG: Uma2 family endonuclease, partial [Ardenticatenaceae bacterium]